MAIDTNELRYQKLLSVLASEMRRNPVTGYGKEADSKVRNIQLQVMIAAMDIISASPELNIIDVVDCITREVTHACSRFKVQSTNYTKPWIDEE